MADPSQRIASGALALGALAGVLVTSPPGSESYILRFAVSGFCIAMGAGLLLRKRGVLHKYMKLIDPVLAARDPDGRSGNGPPSECLHWYADLRCSWSERFQPGALPRKP